ncbi:hypothetical protein FPV67DRAFT_181595 [Lyophyllum atratum]|nr:hypothetical protein FPV67DRAFT_181595 [Lyophyllum atratum]
MSNIGERRQAASVLSNVQAKTSSLSHILQTNDPPSDHELNEITPLLRDVEVPLSRFLREDVHPHFMAEIYSPLEVLHFALKGAVSPLRRIPSEIISLIFLECLSYDACEDEEEQWNSLDVTQAPWNTLDVTQAPWTLARVSRLWREIALADQKLWSCIKVDSWALRIAGRPEPTLPKLIACLERSGRHPLSIHVTDSHPSSFESRPLFLHLQTYSERWEFLRLTVSFQYLQLTVPLKGRLPQLQTLMIEAHGLNDFGVLDAFEVAPNLRKASLVVDDPFGRDTDLTSAITPSGHAPYVITLPWGQLTSLEVDSLEVIRHTPRLVDCTLHLSEGRLSKSVSMIKHASMRNLTTRCGAVLDRLEAPSLESLRIGAMSKSDVVAEITSNFLIRSSCSLKTLFLSGSIVRTESHLQRFLQNTPHLISLGVGPGLLRIENAAQILAISGQPLLVPNLEWITFTFDEGPPYPNNFDLGILQYIVEARCNMLDKDRIRRFKGVTLLEIPRSLLASLTSRLPTFEKLGVEVVYHVNRT